jgi:broad-specificity NMP kinase
MNIKFGIVTMTYDELGKIVATASSFKPTMEIKINKNVEAELKVLEIQNDEQAIVHNAEMIAAGWFSKMTEIELADRNSYHTVSNIIECVKWPNGSVRKVVVELVFKKL